MHVTKFSTAALVAMLATATGSLVQAQSPSFLTDKSCKLVTLTDDFKGKTALDSSKWFVQSGSTGTPKFTKDGLEIHLSALGQSYVIASQKSFSRGTFSFMMKGSNAPGFVSTAVVRPPAAQADGGDEIDVVELVGARPTKPELVAWHKASIPGGSAEHIVNGNQGYTAVDMGVDMSQALHNYTSVWDTNSVKWYYDNKLVYTVNLASSGAQRLTQDMQFKFGPWLSSGTWSGNPDFANHPDPYMLIDSVFVQGCQTVDAAPVTSSSSSSTSTKPATSSSTSTASSASSSPKTSTTTSASKTASTSSGTSVTTGTTSAGSSMVGTSTKASSTTNANTAVSTTSVVENGTTYVYEVSGCTDSASVPTSTATLASNGTTSTATAAVTTPVRAMNGTSLADLNSGAGSITAMGSSAVALVGALAYMLF